MEQKKKINNYSVLVKAFQVMMVCWLISAVVDESLELAVGIIAIVWYISSILVLIFAFKTIRDAEDNWKVWVMSILGVIIFILMTVGIVIGLIGE